jgi:hypothetical protein
LFKAATIFL